MLLGERMSILSPNIHKFYRAETSIFDVDRSKAWAVVKALQSKPAPTVITKKDARFKLNDLRGGQNSTNCSWKNDDHLSTCEFPT